MPSRSDRIEIMQSAARKISLKSSVNLEAYAEETAGYSGADLQAFVYNAHLDAIHETLTSAVDASGQVSSSTAQEEVQYAVVGAIEDEKVLSRAERADMDKRVRQAVPARYWNRRLTSSVRACSSSRSSRRCGHRPALGSRSRVKGLRSRLRQARNR